MIDPSDLQAFLSKIDGGTVAVDLLKIGQNHFKQHSGGKKNNQNSFRVAIDIEDCLDRFYGGYYSDWACGGQWNRAYQFVQLLVNAFQNAHIDLIVFFDGTLKKNKKLSFERNDFRQKTISVLKHIRMIGTPPPKIWWLPPSGIRSTLRNSLRSCNIQVAQTINDHTMEIIEYFHDHKLDGLLGLQPDYIIANISRYFSSHDLRLSYKGALETKEFMVSKLLASLSLTADHLPFVAVFLGGYILIDETKLKGIYECLGIDVNLDFEARIRKIAEIVRNSPTTDIDEFIKHLNLANYESEIKESVEYYQRKGKFSTKGNQRGGNKRRETFKVTIIDSAPPFASETNDDDEATKKILSNVSNLGDDELTSTSKSNNDGTSSSSGGNDDGNNDDSTTVTKSKTAAASTSSGSSNDTSKKTALTTTTSNVNQFIYTLPSEVIKTALNRHQRGIMDPKIYQLLTRREIILPQILEDETYREMPSVHIFYRPARQMIYAILFNLFHQRYLCSRRNNDDKNKDNNNKNKDTTNKKNSTVQKPPEIQVAEWIWSPSNEYKKPDLVLATPLPWAVPTIQRLWFGMAYEDKQRRMKAFLTIMRSDSPLMLNRGYVPQHMLVMACVLRYMITYPNRVIISRQELDAFLATAFSQQLSQVDYTQELVLPGVHLRGVYLATLFMQGVETALLANDACGVPLPWTMTNPLLFFDGKLFHLKLKMSTIVSTLRELCDDHIEIVLKIERFRKAILEDIEHLTLPSTHVDPMYRPGFLPPPTLPVAAATAAFNKTTPFPLAQAAAAAAVAASANNAIYYNTPSPYFSLTPAALLGRDALAGLNHPSLTTSNRNNRNNNQQRNNRKGYQLKVGGIVTGSWASGGHQGAIALFGDLNQGNRSGISGINGGINRSNYNYGNLRRYGSNNRNKLSINTRLHRIGNQSSSLRNIGGGGGGGHKSNVTNKLNQNKRSRQKRFRNKTNKKSDNNKKTNNNNSNNNNNKGITKTEKDKNAIPSTSTSSTGSTINNANSTTIANKTLTATTSNEKTIKTEENKVEIENATVTSAPINKNENDNTTKESNKQNENNKTIENNDTNELALSVSNANITTQNITTATSGGTTIETVSFENNDESFSLTTESTTTTSGSATITLIKTDNDDIRNDLSITITTEFQNGKLC